MGIYGHTWDKYRIDVVYEFNFKDTIENIKQAIKRAILNLINKIDSFLDRCKDSKLKSWCKDLIYKVRKLLVKCNDIETETDAKKLSEELNDYNSEFSDKIKLDFKHVDVHLSEEDLRKIRDILDKSIDFTNTINLINSKKDLNNNYISEMDLKEIYNSVYNKGKYALSNIEPNIKYTLQDKLLELPLYKDGIPELGIKGNVFENEYRHKIIKDEKLQFHYILKLENKFKPLKYNGKLTEKYLEDAKEFIIKTALEFCKNYENRFNKVVRDIEIETFNKEKDKK